MPICAGASAFANDRNQLLNSIYANDIHKLSAFPGLLCLDTLSS